MQARELRHEVALVGLGVGEVEGDDHHGMGAEACEQLELLLAAGKVVAAAEDDLGRGEEGDDDARGREFSGEPLQLREEELVP